MGKNLSSRRAVPTDDETPRARRLSIKLGSRLDERDFWLRLGKVLE